MYLNIPNILEYTWIYSNISLLGGHGGLPGKVGERSIKVAGGYTDNAGLTWSHERILSTSQVEKLNICLSCLMLKNKCTCLTWRHECMTLCKIYLKIINYYIYRSWTWSCECMIPHEND
jgi:hypothetical protein